MLAGLAVLGALAPLVEELIDHVKGGRISEKELRELIISKRVSDFERRQEAE